MAQASTNRIDTPTRLSGVICLLVLVWIVTYWLWEPRHAGGADQPPVTFATDPAQPDSAELQGPPAPPPSIAPADTHETGPVASPTEPRVVPPEFTEYIVQEGDSSIEAISLRHYRTREHAAAILRANPFVDPRKLIPGRTRLLIPEDPGNVQGRVVDAGPEGGQADASTAETAAPASATVEYTITREDTLWDIAEAYYGKGHLWRKIYEANRDVISDPDRPPVGKTIRIPPIE